MGLGEQRDSHFGSPKNPQEHALIVAINMKEQGNWTFAALRKMEVDPSSNDSCNTSNTDRRKSGGSSRNNTPLCAKEIVPDIGQFPPSGNPTSRIGQSCISLCDPRKADTSQLWEPFEI
jgi:hypothetical protein